MKINEIISEAGAVAPTGHGPDKAKQMWNMSYADRQSYKDPGRIELPYNVNTAGTQGNALADPDLNADGNFDIAQDKKPAWAKDLKAGITRTAHPRQYGDTFQTAAYNKREDDQAADFDNWLKSGAKDYAVKNKDLSVTTDRETVNTTQKGNQQPVRTASRSSTSARDSDGVSYGIDPKTGQRSVTTTVSRELDGVPYQQTQTDFYPAQKGWKPGQS